MPSSDVRVIHISVLEWSNVRTDNDLGGGEGGTKGRKVEYAKEESASLSRRSRVTIIGLN